MYPFLHQFDSHLVRITYKISTKTNAYAAADSGTVAYLIMVDLNESESDNGDESICFHDGDDLEVPEHLDNSNNDDEGNNDRDDKNITGSYE